ncbi:breast cancer anti-estrogen resistance protein 3 homolog isoform X1 [Dendrobates tinctorius]|uniref:breast cancer anti-estrogen resistance protein 3 homolog isoform X1 n=2 Tax=Dendrobates tinctorius TaxID=92724 RepID=UPI003CCA2E70
MRRGRVLNLTHEKKMPSSAEAFKKELEEELKLSSEDLRSHAWYHGPLSRQEAERLLQTDGDFLIRDSLSSPGDYVLSCVSNSQVLHFKIIAVTLRPRQGISRVLYQLEQDQFNNIPALVRSYVGDKRTVSESSRAVIKNPLNRTLPISVLRGRQESQRANKENRRSLHLGDSSLLSRNKDRFGSQPGNLDVLKEIPLQSAQSDSNLLSAISAETSGSPEEPLPIPLSPMFRTGSDPVLRAKTQPVVPLDYDGNSALRGSDSQLHSKAPPKPIRAPSVLLPDPPEGSDTYCELVPRAPITKRYVDSLKAEEKWKNRARATETTFGFLDAEKSPEAISSGRVGPCNLITSEMNNSKIIYSELNKSKVVQTEKSTTILSESMDLSKVLHFSPENLKISSFRMSYSKVNQPILEIPEEGDEFVRPQIQTTTSFQPRTFQSILLSPDNKPLEPNALRKLKEIVSQRDCKESALHILREDCQEIHIWGVTKEQQKIMGVQSGLELILLPYGQQLRKDLLERHHLLSLGIAVDILGCTGAVAERAHTLHRIICLASELKDFAGDLFAFSAVMKALMVPQVSRLEQTWQMLRQTHTDSAITFHKHLKPALRDLDECLTEPSPNNVVVPHILPLLKAMEGEDDWGGAVDDSCGRLLRILQAARSYAANAELYQSNAECKLKGFIPQPELREAFKTEFSLRLFWGNKGSMADQTERYKKFDQILNVLSQKLEPETQRSRLASSVYGSAY